MAGQTYFSSDLFSFLRELKANNNRDWFGANKQRYEKSVRDPVLQFITDFAPHLKKINRHFVADPRPHGGSLFRIYRDIRFSSDKSPYKTHVGISFDHERQGEWNVPVFYLHFEPGECFAGAGLWHPDPKTVNKIRSAILNNPKAWKKVLQGGLELQGASLSRPPRGYDPNHPLIKDLMRKDFIVYVPFTDKQVRGNSFMQDYIKACQKMSPLVEFLTKSVGLPW
jgi:uncharacterized protein (TIGR02453 family)